MELLVEIAVTDLVTAQSAAKGGADRIELCCGLSEGGLTPSLGLIRQCREKLDTPLFPILRPRSGDFLYTEEEFELLLYDLAVCRGLGCDGVVAGFLLKDGRVDVKRTAQVVNKAYPMEVTFHRAFDRCLDPFEALEVLCEVGCNRILTSGQQLKAIDALELIGQLVTAADGRIIIMPGSGVLPANIKEIRERTGAVEFHASLRSTVNSNMAFRNPVFEAEQDYLNAAVQEEAVRELKKALSSAAD
jgi:copper homeostasis protein